jgi:glucokinase
MYLVGDIGATNARLAWAREAGEGFAIDAVAIYPSDAAPGLGPLLRRFVAEHPGTPRAAAFGLPGPVQNEVVRTTNIPWVVAGRALQEAIGAPVALLNDLEAAAHGTLVLPPDGAVVLQEGIAKEGSRAVIAAGTGLGQAILAWDGSDWIPSPSEGGHVDFGPRDEEEVELWRFLSQRDGRASYETIVSGRGIAALYDFYADRLGIRTPPWAEGEDRAAAVARAANGATDPAAEAAMDRFVRIYGAQAGNLALTALALGGVWVAGGVAAKNVERMRSGSFIEAFRAKGKHQKMLEEIPVRLVTDKVLALRGAARAAQRLAAGRSPLGRA